MSRESKSEFIHMIVESCCLFFSFLFGFVVAVVLEQTKYKDKKEKNKN